MSKKNIQRALVPKLRFPEFRDAGDWVRGHCIDIAEVLQGYGFPERHQGSNKGLYPFYKVSDISAAFEQGEKYISQANNYIDEDVLSEIGAKPLPKGTTIFAKIGEAIRSNRRTITTRLSVVDNNVAGVKAISGKASDEFLYYLWSNTSLSDFAGGVVPAISKSAIETIPVAYTELEDEQQKIADCLSSLDDLIAVEGQKLTALREHKKGLMQRLFPREGETRPRLRLGNSAWRLVDLADVAFFQEGPGILAKDFRDEGIPLIRLAGLGGQYVTLDGCNHLSPNKVAQKWDHFRLAVDDLLISTSASFGRPAIVTEVAAGAVFYTGLIRFRPTDSRLSREYLEAFLGSPLFLQQAESAATGSGIKHFGPTHLRQMQVVLPGIGEQHRIADCLSSLDALIAAQTEKLDALRSHKRGLMQQLFPAPEDAGA